MSALTRVPLVTGAAQGIDRISLRLAKDGFNVAVSDLPRSRSKLESLTQGIQEKGHVTSEPDVERMVEKVAGDLGGLDVFIANAGICKAQSFLDTSVDDWEDLFRANRRGAFISYRRGRGFRTDLADPFLSAYSASKFSVRGLTQAASLEFGQYGITVNVYAPGRSISEAKKNALHVDIAGLVSYLVSPDAS
ncbi:NAD(P)-binding protein [Pluteus cervinus]|uniref:NAD(P)-binding protein n=1 Tax=Pluteus cervinus TaxID=181527 RepID=A0ACD3ARL3_9AGAR|nr:NAD(P)-binding protein [Pluteus cervinus]